MPGDPLPPAKGAVPHETPPLFADRRRGLRHGGGAMAAEWQGQVMGADARILLRGGAASGAVVDQLLAEIRRVEEVLSLYRDSELTRLNRDGCARGRP